VHVKRPNPLVLGVFVRSTGDKATTPLVIALALMTLGIMGFVGLLASIYLSGQVPQEAPQEAGVDEHLTGPGPQTTPFNSEVIFLGYSDELDERVYGGTKLGGLSGLAYDTRKDLYYAVLDRESRDAPARFYALRLPFDDGQLGDPQILGVTFLRDPSGQPYTGGDFDGEGIAVTSRGELLVASESEPSIRRFSLDGRFLAQLPVARKFHVAPKGQTRSNGSFESLSISPDGRSLFTAPQYPLSVDGRSSEGHHRIRLLLYEKRGQAGFQPSEEFFYLTEPGTSVNDIVALSERKLLVLESSLIFRVSLDEAEDVSGEKALASSQAVPVEKELLVNLADCPLPSVANDRPGFPEGLELGESLPGGGRMLVVVSDDNFESTLKTGVMALAVRMHTSSTPLTGDVACE
jgi:hypothetical protein